MRKNKKIIALLAILAFSFIAALGLSAQTTGEDDDLDQELSLVNDAGEQDLERLLLKLSVEYNVDILVLQDLSAQGYGWGILAQTIGIAPGSAEFHALKLKWGEHQGKIIREVKQERENGADGKNKGENDSPGPNSGKGNGKSGK